jgi:hypothetical protein
MNLEREVAILFLHDTSSLVRTTAYYSTRCLAAFCASGDEVRGDQDAAAGRFTSSQHMGRA